MFSIICFPQLQKWGTHTPTHIRIDTHQISNIRAIWWMRMDVCDVKLYRKRVAFEASSSVVNNWRIPSCVCASI